MKKIILFLFLFFCVNSVNAAVLSLDQYEELGIEGSVYVVGDYIFDLSNYNPTLKDLMLAARTCPNDNVEIYRIQKGRDGSYQYRKIFENKTYSGFPEIEAVYYVYLENGVRKQDELAHFLVSFYDSNNKIYDLSIPKYTSFDAPLAPTKVGYTFLSWLLNNQEYDFSSVLNSNIKLYANWSINKHSIFINGSTCDSGCGVSEISNVNYNSTATMPISLNPVRQDYLFNGWVYDEYHSYVFGTTLMPDKDITLVPSWSYKDYAITYVLNGGVNNPLNPETYNVGSDVVFSNPTKYGHSFSGWDVVSTSGLSGDITVTASWTPNLYNITIDSSTCDSGCSWMIGLNYGEVYNKPSTLLPSRLGYTFDSFVYVENSVQIPYVFGTTTMPGHDITLFPKWSPIIYEITYNLDGGVNNALNPSSYTILDTIVFKEPTKRGYEFISWSRPSILPGSVNDVTITASWRDVRNSISVDSTTCDSGCNGSIMVLNGDRVVNIFNPLRDGYTFLKWFIKNTETEFVFGSNWSGNTDIVLTPVWVPNTYTIVLNANNSEYDSIINNIDTAYDGEYTLPVLNNTLNYEFNGWSIDQNADVDDYVKINNNTNLTSLNNGSVNIYAVWREKKTVYTINFRLNDGKIDRTETKEYDESFNGYIPYSLSGKFIGWGYMETTHYLLDSDLIGSDWTGDALYEAEADSIVSLNDYELLNSSGKNKCIPIRTVQNIPAYLAVNDSVVINNLVAVNNTVDLYAVYEPYMRVNLYGIGSSCDKNQNNTCIVKDGGYVYSNSIIDFQNETVYVPKGQLLNNILDFNKRFENSSVGYVNSSWHIGESVQNCVEDSSYSCYSSNVRISKTEFSFDTDVINNDVSLYFVYEPITYNVHFDLNGGTGNVSDIELSYDEEFSLSNLGVIAPNGSSFVGWSLSDNTSFGNLINQIDKYQYSSDITLHAIYNYDLITLNLNYNDDSGVLVQHVINKTDILLSPYSFPATGNEKNIVFWSTDANGNIGSNVLNYPVNQLYSNFNNVYGEQLNLYAIYVPDVFTVKYNGIDSLEELGQSNVHYGDTINIPSNDFIKSNTRLIGYEISDMYGNNYFALKGSNFNFNFDSINEVLNFNAVYLPDWYDYTGDSFVIDSQIKANDLVRVMYYANCIRPTTFIIDGNFVIPYSNQYRFVIESNISIVINENSYLDLSNSSIVINGGKFEAYKLCNTLYNFNGSISIIDDSSLFELTNVGLIVGNTGYLRLLSDGASVDIISFDKVEYIINSSVAFVSDDLITIRNDVYFKQGTLTIDADLRFYGKLHSTLGGIVNISTSKTLYLMGISSIDESIVMDPEDRVSIFRENNVIAYDMNGGLYSNSDLIYDQSPYDDFYNIKDFVPKRDGFTFIGWSFESDGIVIYKNDDLISNVNEVSGKNDEIYLYAIYVES